MPKTRNQVQYQYSEQDFVGFSLNHYFTKTEVFEFGVTGTDFSTTKLPNILNFELIVFKLHFSDKYIEEHIGTRTIILF